MKFTNTLIKGKLIKRYKRFFTDIKVNNSIVTAHCPNTGSMKGLLDKDNTVFLSKNDDPKRKLKFTLEIIEANKKLVGVNTHRANKIVADGLNKGLINEFKSIKNIKPEFKFSNDTDSMLNKYFTKSKLNLFNSRFTSLAKSFFNTLSNKKFSNLRCSNFINV